MWEYLLLNKSVMIYSQSPKSCAIVSFAIMYFIQPLSFKGMLKPYLTIYDPDHQKLS